MLESKTESVSQNFFLQFTTQIPTKEYYWDKNWNIGLRSEV